jgi:membrane protein DedA with SNARE-associated domain
MDLNQIVESIVAFTRDHPNWIALVAFLLATLEFMPGIWLVLVGVAAIVGPDDPLRLWGFVISSALGGAVGDTFLYWLGGRFGGRVAAMWPFRRYPHLLERSSVFFKKWGAGAVIAGRFLGPARAGVPVVAGTLNMPWARFVVATLFGAHLWAVVFLWPAALGGGVLTDLL